MGLKNFFFGKKEKTTQQPTMDPQQLQLLQQMMGGLQGPMQQGMGQLGQQLQGYGAGQSPMEQMAQQQFQQQTVPELAEQFAGLGASSSSGFGQQMGAQGANLQAQMAQLRQQQQQQAMGNLMNFSQMGMGAKPFENIFRPETFGLVGQLGQGLGQGLGSFGSMAGMGALGNMFGGGGNDGYAMQGGRRYSI